MGIITINYVPQMTGEPLTKMKYRKNKNRNGKPVICDTDNTDNL